MMLSFLLLLVGVQASLQTDCDSISNKTCFATGCIWCPGNRDAYCDASCEVLVTEETGAPQAVVGFANLLSYVNSVEVTWDSVSGDVDVLEVSVQVLTDDGAVDAAHPPFNVDLVVGQHTSNPWTHQMRASGAPAPTVQTIDGLMPATSYKLTAHGVSTTGQLGPDTSITVKTELLNSQRFPGLIGTWTTQCFGENGEGNRQQIVFAEANYQLSWQMYFDDKCEERAAEYNVNGEWYLERTESDTSLGVLEWHPQGQAVMSLFDQEEGVWPSDVTTILDALGVPAVPGGQYYVPSTCEETGKEFIEFDEIPEGLTLADIMNPPCSVAEETAEKPTIEDGLQFININKLVDALMAEGTPHDDGSFIATSCDAFTNQTCFARGCVWCAGYSYDEGSKYRGAFCDAACGDISRTSMTGPPGKVVGFSSPISYVNDVQVTWESASGDVQTMSVDVTKVNADGSPVTDHPENWSVELFVGQYIRDPWTGDMRQSGAPAPTVQSIDGLMPDSYYKLTINAQSSADFGPPTSLTVKTQKLNSDRFPSLIGTWTTVCSPEDGEGNRQQFTFTEATYNVRWEMFFDDKCEHRAAEFNVAGFWFVSRLQTDSSFGLLEFHPKAQGVLSLYSKEQASWPEIVNMLMPEGLEKTPGGQYLISHQCEETGTEFIDYEAAAEGITLANILSPACSVADTLSHPPTIQDGLQYVNINLLVDTLMTQEEADATKNHGGIAGSIFGGLDNKTAGHVSDAAIAFSIIFALTTLGFGIAFCVQRKNAKLAKQSGDTLLGDYSEM